MTEQANPALSNVPEEAVSIGAIRERVAVALTVYGSDLPEMERIRLAEAVARPSPVDCVVRCYIVLAANAPDLGAVMLSRAIECAEIIVLNSFHGKADEASAFAATARANLAGR